jgi:hypothetical protein
MSVLNGIYTAFQAHPGWVMGLTLVLSTSVDAMDAPTKPGFYRWFYTVSHALLLHADKFQLVDKEKGK